MGLGLSESAKDQAVEDLLKVLKDSTGQDPSLYIILVTGPKDLSFRESGCCIEERLCRIRQDNRTGGLVGAWQPVFLRLQRKDSPPPSFLPSLGFLSQYLCWENRCLWMGLEDFRYQFQSIPLSKKRRKLARCHQRRILWIENHLNCIWVTNRYQDSLESFFESGRPVVQVLPSDPSRKKSHHHLILHQLANKSRK